MPKAEQVFFFFNEFELNFLLLAFKKIMMGTDGTYVITTRASTLGYRMV